MFEVRQATPADVDSIITITKEAFAKYIEIAGISDTAALHETREDVLHDLHNKLVYVAFMNRRVVGSVRIELLDTKTAYLSRFGVSMDFQNLGIGKAIINAVDMDMLDKGVERVRLHTASKAFPLVRFYYGRGFYVESTSTDMGYIRVAMCKEYPKSRA